MKQEIDVNKLLFFLLEQDAHVNLHEGEIEILVNDLMVKLKETNFGNSCTITVYDHRAIPHLSKQRAIWYRAMPEMLTIIEACQKKSQKNLFRDSTDDYIKEHGEEIRFNFLEQLNSGNIKLVDSDIIAQSLHRQQKYRATLSTQPHRFPIGTLKVMYQEHIANSILLHTTIFIFTQTEFEEHRGLRQWIEDHFKRYERTDLFSNPLFDYCSLQESMEVCSKAKPKSKI